MIWRWEIINEWIAGKDLRLGCEVGVKEGRFISYLLANNPNLSMYAVDPWEDQPEGNETYKDWHWINIYAQYREKVESNYDRVIELEDYSVDAAARVDDGTLDFVFLDAQHDYESIKQDIELWCPKVKKGGLVAGHDYSPKFPGVIQAVDEAFPSAMTGDDTVWGLWKR